MIIGISGKAGTGKDTICDIAVNYFGAEKVSFASGLKEECADFLTSCNVAWHKNNLYGSQAEKEMELGMANSDGVVHRLPEFADFIEKFAIRDSWFLNNISFSGRSLLQWWGTEYRRKQDDLYWVNKCLAKCTENKVYVISDCRFKNEAKAIRDSGGFLIRLERPDGIDISNMQHASEIDLDDWIDWDAEITNMGPLNEFQHVSWEILRDLIHA